MNIDVKELQKIELDILRDINEFCHNNNIEYSLIAGTLLGAARHKGFIPWDDDVDIAMKRTEFNKFCKAWEKHPLEGYILDNYKTDAGCFFNHSKIRKKNTLYLMKGEPENIGHHEIWIDIFPIDKVSKNRFNKSRLLLNGMLIVFLTRAAYPLKSNNKIKNVINRIIRLFPLNTRKKILDKATNNIIHLNNITKDNYNYVSMSCFESMKIIYPKKCFDSGTTTLPFEDTSFCVYNNYKTILKCLYGDYMKLPPESERTWRHKPQKIIF